MSRAEAVAAGRLFEMRDLRRAVCDFAVCSRGRSTTFCGGGCWYFGGEVVGCAATGRGLGGCSAISSIGIEKQQSCRLLDCFFLGRLGSFSLNPSGYRLARLAGRAAVVFVDGRFFSSKSTRPSLSARVSILVRSSRIDFMPRLGPGLDTAECTACSLCCQQYKLSSARSSLESLRGGVFPEATDRRQGLPAEVMPRHVELGSLESDRARRDSGVLATKGMAPCSRSSEVVHWESDVAAQAAGDAMWCTFRGNCGES